ncbi:MAG: hypothetical protein ABW032_10105 [Burkholderiaceae bacterium]
MNHPIAVLSLMSGLLAVAGCARAPVPTAAPAPVPPSAFRPAEFGPPPQALDCPSELPAGTRCLGGRDGVGADYLIAVPSPWNGVLVLHAHGGPTLGPPKAARAREDLQRWAVMVKAGYAWAGSTYRDGGVQVHAAAEDTERLRRLFVRDVARPSVTVLHGQSWGASVAAVAAEADAVDPGTGRRPYDAVLLTSGVLAGGTRAYDFRLDLRVVYQALCGNHPRPDEPPYPLWMGLPQGTAMTRAELARRADECLGVQQPAARRTPDQQRRLKTILDVVHIPERTLLNHLGWATWQFQDIALHRTGGGSAFGNMGAVYAGSDDDAGLNARVARYRADPAAVARFGADSDPTGRIPVPVLTVHAVDDPEAFVEMDDTFLATMRRAGTDGHLVQTFTADHEHSYLTDPAYPTLMAALLAWAAGGAKPTPSSIAASCASFEPRFGAGCRFLPEFHPRPLATRVAERERP